MRLCRCLAWAVCLAAAAASPAAGYPLNDNYNITLDLDWVVRPGLSLYGEL
jgi:hypothetical protein